jgi:formylglycine-generating enzyme required for sulfatase activity
VKNDIQSTQPTEQPSPKALLDQTSPESLVRKWITIGKSWFSGRTSGLEYTDFSRAETATMLKKHFQRAKRRKRWMKTAGIIGVMLILLGGIGIWLWDENMTFKVAILRAASTVMSIHVEPEMVSIPAGTFQQGNIHGEDESSEHPIRDVSIKKFAMGRFEVTFEEYDRFAIATDRPLPRDEGWGRGSRPVINVSWEDAVNYAKWLAQQTGRRYRLPAETEWEYAARNGGKDEIWAGTSDAEQLADYAWFNINSTGRTQPVGTKKPNGLGLKDMSGNVWEWVEDCWHDDYNDAPTDNSAGLEGNGGNCGMRLRRGGAWTDSPMSLRSSFRNGYSADTRSILIGFRLAQDID